MRDEPTEELAPGAVPGGLVDEVMALLVALRRTGAEPEEAQEALADLAGRRGAELELVWEAESYPGGFHYDALIHAAGGTFSLAWCADEGLPWPTRGVQRWTERCVGRVDGAVIDVETAFSTVDFLWSELHLGRRLVERHIAQRADSGPAHGRDPIDIGDDEVAAALEEFRRERGLHSVDQTRDWMREHGVSQARLEEHVRVQVRGRRLRARIAAASPEGPPAAYFERHRAELELLHLSRIGLDDRAEAERLADRVRRAPDTFWAAARARMLERGRCDASFVALRRGDVDPAHAALLDAAPGQVVGPLPAGDGWDVVQLLARRPARLDRATEDLVARRLYDAWLADAVRRARIEWFWGAAQPVLADE